MNWKKVFTIGDETAHKLIERQFGHLAGTRNELDKGFHNRLRERRRFTCSAARVGGT
jgi:hypothetical protein